MLTPPSLGYGHGGGEGELYIPRLPRQHWPQYGGRFSLRPSSLPAHFDAQGCPATYLSSGYKHIALIVTGGVGGHLPSVQDNIFILQRVRLQKWGGRVGATGSPPGGGVGTGNYHCSILENQGYTANTHRKMSNCDRWCDTQL